MASELREKLAEAIANAEAEAGYNWCWDEDTGEHFPKWEELSEEDEECGNDHWVRGRNSYRMRAAADLAALNALREATMVIVLRDDLEEVIWGIPNEEHWDRLRAAVQEPEA